MGRGAHRGPAGPGRVGRSAAGRTERPLADVAAGLVGGSTAPASHAAKAGTRMAVSSSPEPFSNVTVSPAEDLGVGGIVTCAMFHPEAAAIVAGGLLVTGQVVLFFLVSRIRRLRRRGARRREERRLAARAGPPPGWTGLDRAAGTGPAAGGHRWSRARGRIVGGGR